MDKMDFKTEYNEYVNYIQGYLKKVMPAPDKYPEKIHEAVNYTVFAGGKRLRPVLCTAVFRLFSDNADQVLPIACALEYIHTYSLIHDDLPCMDDDDFRRGKPTCHKKYGEAIAVLAGDALLTEAFYMITRCANIDVIADIVAEIALACGSTGLIGGQVMDILSENDCIDEKKLLYIHENKTGKLIRASVRSGALCAGAGMRELIALSDYGDALGLAFQISDDILDVVGSTENMGKTVGQDEKLHKATFPSIFGLEASKKKLYQAVDRAQEAVTCFGEKSFFLEQLAQFVAQRDR